MPKFTDIINRFKNREDTEHQQAFVRLVIGIALSLLMLPKAIAQNNIYFIWVNGITFCAAASIPVWIYLRPAQLPIRRIFGIVTDTVTLTLVMIVNGEHWMVFYVLFIWTTSGYGFRFGPKYLLISFFFSLIGLTLSALFSEGANVPVNLFVELIIAYICLCLYIHSLAKRLYVALENANLASDAKRQFLSSMSHEIRTPLHAIAGLAELLEGMVSKPQEKELTILIDSSVNQVLHLVNAVLDFSKIEAGKIEIENTLYNLDRLIASISHLYIQQAQAKKIEFHTRVSLSVPEWIQGDQYRIQQVVTNLISNAFKFTLKGKVALVVDVEVNQAGKKYIKFTISDTGIGIPFEMQSKIFDSFTQADASTSRRYGGTGLGTTIAQQLVGLMEGDIGLVSEVGKGSSFWFTIPYKEEPEEVTIDHGFMNTPLLVLSVDDKHQDKIKSQCLKANFPVIHLRSSINRELSNDDSQAIGLITQTYSGSLPNEAKNAMRSRIPVIATAFDCSSHEKSQIASTLCLAICENPQEIPRAVRLLQSWSLQNSADGAHFSGVPLPLAPKRILIADDNVMNIQILSQTLENDGHFVVQVNDGEAALDKFGGDRFDLVILDYNMPYKNGIQVTQMLRVLEVGANLSPIPIVILSADATKETTREAIDAGATAYISKPIKPTELLEKLTNIMATSGDITELNINSGQGTVERNASTGKHVILDLETVKQLEAISRDPNFVPYLIKGYIGDGDNHIQRIKGAFKKNDYEEWKDSVHAFRSASCSLGLVSLHIVLANANLMAKKMFLANGHNMILQIEEEYRKAALALDKLYA